MKRKPTTTHTYSTRSKRKRVVILEDEIKAIDTVKVEKVEYTTTKDYMKTSNENNPWLLRDGKKMYKNKYGQTCYRYVCPFQHLDGKICGRKPYLPKDSISVKGFCRNHQKKV